MQVLREEELKPLSPVITMGTFDGVHLGHQKIISEVVQSAKALQRPSLLITFEPHPRSIIDPDYKMGLLTTLDEKLKKLAVLDYVLVLNFNQELRSLSAKEFVTRILLQKLEAKKVILGFDHSFGKGRIKGEEAFREFAFEFKVVAPVKFKGEIVKSSSTRDYLKRGNISLVNQFLGYPYTLEGVVVKGEGIGRRELVPTINLEIATDKLIPGEGVYIGRASFGEDSFQAAINIGKRRGLPLIEAHLLDFSGDIYDETVKLEFFSKIRDQIIFSHSKELLLKIKQDILAVSAFFKVLQ